MAPKEEARKLGGFVPIIIIGVVSALVIALLLSCALVGPFKQKTRRNREAASHDLESNSTNLEAIDASQCTFSADAFPSAGPSRVATENAEFAARYQAYADFANHGAQPPPVRPPKARTTEARHSVDV